MTDQQNTVGFSKNQATGVKTSPTYLPFGDPASSGTFVGERGYLDKVQDPHGDVRLDHRTYNAGLNILTTPDPLMVPSEPQSLNPYAYSRNNPVAFVDPFGLGPSPLLTQTPCIATHGCEDPDPASTSTGGGSTTSSWGTSSTVDQADSSATEDSGGGGILSHVPNPIDLAGNAAQAAGSAVVAMSYGLSFTPQGRGATERFEAAYEPAEDEFVKHLLFASLFVAPEAGPAIGVLRLAVRGPATRAAAKVGGRVAPDLLRVGELKLPKGAVGVPTQSGKGLEYAIPRGTPEISEKVASVRIMNPVTSGKYQYPNGYAVYMNGSGQTINPLTGQTIARTDPYAHISLP